MSHPLIPELIQMLQEAKAFDFSTGPAIKFMASLRDKLIFTGFTQEDAETIVSSMDIDTPPGSIDDEQIETITTLYCELLNKLHQGLVDNGFKYPLTSLLNMSKKLTLTLS